MYYCNMNEYDHKQIEKKWQEKWQESQIYKTKETSKDNKNFYTLVEFPYPSGNLHIGHWYAFAVPDIYSRLKRMQGYNVLFPIGFDAFGLPAENAAIKRGLDPKKWTYENIAYMEGQLASMGNSFDWSRKVITADEEYYKWTQWLFIELYKKGLAYKNKASVNWCPKDNTVLANEQVVGGKCERCGTEVTQKNLEQWFFKITDYAERLISDLDNLDWPEAIKDSQRNWIGKSEGAEIEFKIENSEETVTIFTTRADTLFGVTYIVLAPENPKLDNLKSKIENWSEVENYINEVKKKTEIERTDAKKEKTGVEIKGIKAINPATGESIPVYVADYVLVNYGTGAVMAVPAHDERDFDFAQKYNLEIKDVVIRRSPDLNNPHVEGKEVVFRDGILAIVYNPNTKKYLCLKWKRQPWTTFVMGGIEEGESSIEAAKREVREETGYKNVKLVKELLTTQSEFFAAHKDVNRIAHTRSILFELIDEEKEEISAEESAIHEMEWRDMEGIKSKDMTHSEMPFIIENIENEKKPFVGDGIMFDSGEFTKLTNKEACEKITEKFGKKVTKYKLRDWLLSRQRYWGCPIPVVYDPEGKPHIVKEEHLPWTLPEDVDFTPKGESPLATSTELKNRVEKLYGKGWTPEYDTMDTFVDSSWYFLRYTDNKNKDKFADKEKLKEWLPIDRYSGGAEHTTMHLLYSRFFHKALFDLDLVPENEPFKSRMNRGLILGPDGQKMSKSKGNVIDPDEWVSRVGADTVRLYLAFIGPFNEVGQYPWDLGGIAGVRRFLERVWKLKNNISDSTEIENILNKTIKKVTEDNEQYKFNTAISSLMILLNAMEKQKFTKSDYEVFLRLLAPCAPHITEELWSMLGYTTSIHTEKWQEYDESKMIDSFVNIVIQVNGKVRSKLETEANIDEKTVTERVKTMEDVQKWIAGKTVKKTIFVPNKILNIVLED